ncbi:hypothetical protein B5P45_22360 [Phyllobacterium zundukense]|uniref:Response regulatory domain-containing protein n=2 Tax=Phyllobacterium zundukense TaxID=1867719 RepID=A0A2N9VT21_9HYPH|nr:hypothetical protein BLM14_21250 [Phyllobacterium zundukense]PIO42639.1 hypothetical protein B5P45_22360 [Phyllobacterium zundukense]
MTPAENTNAIPLLLVEDHALLNLEMERELTDAGYTIVTATDGAKALAELNMDSNKFKGLITDVNIGKGPSGWDVARRLRERMPNVPVVYITGDNASEWTSRGVPNSILLQKPFAPGQLTTAISQLLNRISSDIV